MVEPTRTRALGPVAGARTATGRGALFVFIGRRGTAAKVLFFDGTGLCLFHKRLDRGVFRVPPAPAPGAAHLEIDEATFEALLDGLAIAPQEAVRRAPRRLLQ